MPSQIGEFLALFPLSVLVWAGHMVVFHGAGLGFELCDRKGWLRRYKQRDRERLAYADILPRVLLNQTFVLLPAMWLCEKFGLAYTGPEHIGWAWAIAAIVLMTIGHDIVQYFAHRFLLHNPRFRWLGHGIHHSTGASKSITACYMSAPDFFLTIVCPYLVPLILIGGGTGDLGFQLLVAGLGAVGGLYEHSGYDFAAGIRQSAAAGQAPLLRLIPPSLVSSHAHGEHHRRSRVSFSDGFGSPGLCDAIFRTRWDLR
ncbi:MAG TPA: sterol desaturase family protein [Rhizomicrobium sp.]|jgi:sterol desaturase/sphingolipid hydroxylase (fatty acid hydroxylase superfamily)|nr:sterol desaturase family protein [Rhizomicrobium sp.]